MKFDDFKIGKKFATETGIWIVSDIGTRTVIAYKEIRKDPNFNWDEKDNVIFYSWDWKGCVQIYE